MQEIERKIKEHIADGYTNFLDLTFNERAQLTAILLRKEKDEEWMFDSGIFETSLNVLSDLDSPIINLNKNLLVSRVISAAIRHCESELIRTFEYIYDAIQKDKNLEAGLRPFIDAINGELRWFKT